MVREYNGSTYETLFTFVSLRHLLVIKEACGVVNGVFDWGACHLKKHFVFLELGELDRIAVCDIEA